MDRERERRTLKEEGSELKNVEEYNEHLTIKIYNSRNNSLSQQTE